MTHAATQQQRPPYVEFEQRSVEDVAETIKQGRPVFRDVDYALVRQLGSNDFSEKELPAWLDHIDKLALRGSYRREWAKFFRELYQEWKSGHELPVNGTHVKNWPGITKAQCDTLIAARIITVEDLAGANEEALRRIGMGSRSLKQKAQAWIDAAAQTGGAEELAMLREKTVNQDEQIARLTDTVQSLMGQLEDLTKTEKRRKAS